jgi:hypothetical protein
MPDCPDECTAFLLALSKDPAHCFPEVAESAVAGLDRIGIQDAKLEAFDWEAEERRRPLGPQFLENLLQALQRFKTATHCEAVAEKLAARPETFSPVTLVVPALERIYAGWGRKAAASDSSVVHLWTRSADFLLRRSEFLPNLRRTGVWM